jgi:hypothetical protein
MPLNIGCQNVASLIQGDKNAVAAVGCQNVASLIQGDKNAVAEQLAVQILRFFSFVSSNGQL